MKYDGVTPILEEDHGFSLVLHQRDFLPGRTILANIQNAVSTTRRMIMLLSRLVHCAPPSKLNFNSIPIERNSKKSNKKQKNEISKPILYRRVKVGERYLILIAFLNETRKMFSFNFVGFFDCGKFLA